jgi:hypothetical protein
MSAHWLAVHEAGHFVAAKMAGLMPIAWELDFEQGVARTTVMGVSNAPLEVNRRVTVAGAAAEIAIFGAVHGDGRHLFCDLDTGLWAGDADFDALAEEVAASLDVDVILAQAERMEGQPSWRSF